ncbi:hypothetical protein EDD18DRAFT_1310716 [Armillaria luteobubalina]|uniref:Uncharacterized protein n=1 Tax=Armillaria luteobubalina TaxID=153913 RepID=A0AA39Q016_9AGAR|nr:hypothetical protein EDD18DRAFT_1310716 [Armillaria luteobubalina]
MGACWELCHLQNGMGCATVFLPVAWSLAMVYWAHPELTGMACLTQAAIYFFLCIGIKCLIMTIDDILNNDIDVNVKHMKNRALPRGAISIEQAWLFFTLQVVIGVFLAYKVLKMHSHTHHTCPFSLHISMYVWLLYMLSPTCKCWITIMIYITLLILTLTSRDRLDLAPDSKFPYVSLSATMWMITYEMVYQHQDKVDDVKIGMKSLTILCLMLLASYLNDQGIAFYIAMALSAIGLLKGLIVTDVDKPKECMQFFLHTLTIGNLILAGLVVDAVVHRVIEGIPLQHHIPVVLLT